MQLDEDRALEILEEECKRATGNGTNDEWSVRWKDRIRELCTLAEQSSETYIAAFATQALAKATNLKAYTLSKNIGDKEGGYSARGFCKRVVAAHAPRLGIDLGVTGREPLNNQPFFYVTYMDEARHYVKSNAIEAYDLLVELLKELNDIESEKKAREILRAFLQLRLKEKRVAPDAEAGDITRATFYEIARKFVSRQSELGKRAQAMTAAFLDATFGRSRIKTNRIHDPDRRFPGDIIVLGEHEVLGEHKRVQIAVEKDGSIQMEQLVDAIQIAFEVRDKPVQQTDLYHFARKVSKAGQRRAGIVAVANSEDSSLAQNMDGVRKFAAQKGVNLRVYFTWERFGDELNFWTDRHPSAFVSQAYDALIDRAVELEVSQKAIDWWADHGES